ncbi:hypothetical protein Q604_UNBC16755G0002, partial [human gut metagenome]
IDGVKPIVKATANAYIDNPIAVNRIDIIDRSKQEPKRSIFKALIIG